MMRLPSTRMSALSGSTLVPISVTMWPSTSTRPSRIIRSATRRAAIPACDNTFCSRTPSVSAIGVHIKGDALLTGASASVKGYPNSSAFAMGKFALSGLAQSMARELSPKNVHVAHFVIDGGIRSAARVNPNDNPDSFLDPDAIAETYWQVANQPRSAWTWEVELRGSGAFGGFSDNTQHPDRNLIPNPKRLIVKGGAVFGGVTIKN